MTSGTSGCKRYEQICRRFEIEKYDIHDVDGWIVLCVICDYIAIHRNAALEPGSY